MGRSRFETAADRAREQAVAIALGTAWQCDMRPAPDLAGYDYTAVRSGQSVAVVEIKSRLNRVASDFGGYLFINVHKYDSLRAAASNQAVRAAIFVWHFPGSVYWVNTADLFGRSSEIRGRVDRDGLDQHPVIRIHLSEASYIPLPGESRWLIDPQTPFFCDPDWNGCGRMHAIVEHRQCRASDSPLKWLPASTHDSPP